MKPSSCVSGLLFFPHSNALIVSHCDGSFASPSSTSFTCSAVALSLNFKNNRVLQFTVLARLLWLPPIVDDKHLVQMRPQRRRERLVVRMRQILRAARLIRKREQEAVRETVVETDAY